MNNLLRFVFYHKKKVLVWLTVIVLTCLSFYYIFIYVHPKQEVCTLTQKYSNYTNSIKVTITGENATIEEDFKSKDKDIIEYKRLEYLKKNYHVILKMNSLNASKIIDGKNIKKEYIDSGYTCDGKKKYIDVKFSLSNNDNDLEVKSPYNSELKKAMINNIDYSDKVVFDNSVNSNKLGKYVVSYKLNISNRRDEYIYKVINVVDTKAPLIILNGTGSYALFKGETFKEEGYKVQDNYDKEDKLKVKVQNNIDYNTPGMYKVLYTVVDTSGNKTVSERVVTVRNRGDNLTYVNGILIVNKSHSVPSDYGSGLLDIVYDAYSNLKKDALDLGYDIPLKSGFRTYEYQNKIYNNYIKLYGKEEADTFSAPPGCSEHQTGLAMDVGKIDDDYDKTKEGSWLQENAYKYGFIIRYARGKESITGYKYEPWHIRYLGIDTATKVYNSGLSLEEYLNIS